MSVKHDKHRGPRVGERAYWINKHNGRIVQTTYGRHGQPVYHREVTAPCNRCKQDHTFVMTSKPKKFCPTCVPIVKEEKAQREKQIRLRKKLEQGSSPPAPKPRKLIRYAGYPRSKYE